MTDPRIDRVIEAIQTQFPGTTVVRGRCVDPEARDIECVLEVRNAPSDPPWLVEDFALTFAIELYGDDPIPFFVTAIAPQESVGRDPATARRSRATGL